MNETPGSLPNAMQTVHTGTNVIKKKRIYSLLILTGAQGADPRIELGGPSEPNLRGNPAIPTKASQGLPQASLF